MNNLNHGGTNLPNFIDFSISVNPFSPKFLKNVYKNIVNFDKKYNYIEWIEEDFKKIFGKNSSIVAGATEAFYIIGWTIMENSTVLIPQPNYSEYEKIAKFKANKLYKVNYFIDDKINFEIVLKEIKKLRKNEKSKIVLIFGNPHNPTGIYSKLKDFLEEVTKYDIIVIIDEAFIDFVKPSKLENNNENNKINYDNLILIRSFTKILGIPGIRIGYLKTDKFLNIFENFRQPWAIGSSGFLTLKYLIENFYEFEKFKINSINFFNKEKEKFKEFIKVSSDTNYFMIKTKNKTILLNDLYKNSIFVRDLGNLGLNEWIRIGIKKPNNNNLLKKILIKNKESIFINYEK